MPANQALYSPMLWLAAATALGCGVGQGPVWPWWLAAVVLALAGAWFPGRLLKTRAAAWLMAVLCAGGAMRAASEARAVEVASNAEHLQGRPLARWEGAVERVVSTWPRVRVQVRLVANHAQTGSVPFEARALVGLPPLLSWPQEGQTMLFRARLYAPRQGTWPGDFNMRSMLASHGVELAGNVHAATDVAVIASEASSWIARWVVRARNATRTQVQASLPTDAASLVEAFVLGDAPDMDPEIRATFDAAGASHLLAVSGLQATLLAALAFALLRKLWGRVPGLLALADPAPAAALACLPLLMAYALYAGGAASVMRSAWMAAAIMLGVAMRRKGATAQALGAAACMMLWLEPRAVHDAGFLLSFFSVLGLVLLTPGLLAAFGRTPDSSSWRAWFAAALASSAASWVATLPLVAWMFGRVAPWGLLSNLLLVPMGGVALPVTVLATMLGAALQWTLPIRLAGAVSMALWDACRPWAALPGALVEINTVSVAAVVVALLGALLMAVGTRRALAASAAVIALAMVAGLVPSLPSKPALRLLVAPVGQGDGMILSLPDGQHMVVDGGGSFLSQDDPGARVLVPMLERMGVQRLAAVILSHPHPDHHNGLVSVVRRFAPAELWWNGQRSQHPRFVALMDAVAAAGTRVVIPGLVPGAIMRRNVGGAAFEVLHPYPPRDGPDAPSWFPELGENDNSLVVRVGFAGHHVLLAGDIEHEAEQWLANDPGVRGLLAADVLKVPHHGSRTSSTPALLDAVGARHGVMGVGQRNPWGFPHPDVLERLAQRGINVWRTDRDGLITVELDEDGVRVGAFLR